MCPPTCTSLLANATPGGVHMDNTRKQPCHVQVMHTWEPGQLGIQPSWGAQECGRRALGSERVAQPCLPMRRSATTTGNVRSGCEAVTPLNLGSVGLLRVFIQLPLPGKCPHAHFTQLRCDNSCYFKLGVIRSNLAFHSGIERCMSRSAGPGSVLVPTAGLLELV